MIEVSGLSLGSIQRLTKAMWNTASRENSKEAGRQTGYTWKGKKRPGQLERQWKSGVFDSLRGRVRPPEERARLKAGWTPEVRAKQGRRLRTQWSTATFREKLLAFHRAPEERARRSFLQTERMLRSPWTYGRGRGSWVTSPKCREGVPFWVRSSYEKRAVDQITRDANVLSFEYEARHQVGTNTLLPDFIVHYEGRTVLVEVKSQWVRQLPAEDRVQIRLQRARHLAQRQGWDFTIWTEADLGL